MIAGGVATNVDGDHNEGNVLRTSSTAGTSTRRPAAADPDDRTSGGDRVDPVIAVSAEQNAVGSRQPGGPPISVQTVSGDVVSSVDLDKEVSLTSVQVVPDDVLNSVDVNGEVPPISVQTVPGDVVSRVDVDKEVPPTSVQVVPDSDISSVGGATTGNISDVGDFESRPELRQDKDDGQVFQNVQFQTQLVDGAVLQKDDYHQGVPNDDENGQTDIAPTPSTQTLAAENTKSSIIEHEMPMSDYSGDVGPTNTDGEVVKAPTLEGLDNEATSSVLNGDSALKLLEQIVTSGSSVADTNTDNIRTDVGADENLFQRDTTRKQATAGGTSNNLDDVRRTPGPDLQQTESTIIALQLPASFPQPDNEKASRMEPPSQNQQIMSESSDRGRYNAPSSHAATATVKPKPDVVAGNGNSMSACCCLGRFICAIIVTSQYD